MMNGSALRRLRREAHLSQDALAKLALVSRRSVIAYEANEAQPTVGAAVRIADVLGVSLDELVDRETPEVGAA